MELHDTCARIPPGGYLLSLIHRCPASFTRCAMSGITSLRLDVRIQWRSGSFFSGSWAAFLCTETPILAWQAPPVTVSVRDR